MSPPAKGPVLPDEIVAMLAAGLEARPVPAQIKDELMRRVAGARTQPYTLQRADEGEWAEAWPGVFAKRIGTDGPRTIWLARIEPGGEIPPHDHDEDEDCYVIEGAIDFDGLRLAPGDFYVALRGSHHQRVYSPTGCLVLVRAGTLPAPTVG